MLARRPLSVFPFVALAYCGPLIGRNPQCISGNVQCCQSVQSAGSPLVTTLASLLGVLSDLVDGTQVGVQCSSITGAGSGADCKSQPVCCNGTNYQGLINMGCSPIEL